MEADELPMIYATDFLYNNRETKARYVWLKYRPLLRGSILDVGADQCYLRSYLEGETAYWGIGLGGCPDQEVDLEAGALPFADGSFDCVLCLDVLEHLENIHGIFDELCRVSRNYVVVSLPNAHADFLRFLFSGNYRPEHSMKFYGLPPERPHDRHKWFFSAEEGRTFIQYRANLNKMKVVQMDYEIRSLGGPRWRRWLWALSHRLVFSRDFDWSDVHLSTLWVVLEKAQK